MTFRQQIRPCAQRTERIGFCMRGQPCDVGFGSGARVKSAATLTSLPQIAVVISDGICVADRKAADFSYWDEASIG